MDVGRSLEKVAQAGRTATTGTWGVLHRTSAVLAVVMRFLNGLSERWAERFDRAGRRLERFARVSRARQMGVPLGADLAGDDWDEPELLPVAPTPPPIPPVAFFQSRGSDEEWGAAIEAAKHATPPPEADDEWEAAMLAAKKAAVTAPQSTETPAAAPPSLAATGAKVGPGVDEAAAPHKVTASEPAAVAAKSPAQERVPRATLLGLGVNGRLPAKAAQPQIGAQVDPHLAAATRKAVASALRLPSA